MSDKIIVLSGKQFCGKDTIAKILLNNFKSFRRVGLGDAIKIEYGEKIGLTFDEIENNKSHHRKDLIEWGNMRRAQDCDYWIKRVIATDGDLIVPDIRVKRELEYFRKENAFKIRVESDRTVRAKRDTLTNESDLTETDLDDVTDWDYVIENNLDYETLVKNTEVLMKHIEKFLNN